MNQPPKPAAPGTPAKPKQTIQVESNDAVQDTSTASVESVVDTSHPAGIVIETFVGLQSGVSWAEPAAAEAPAAE